MQVVTGLDFGQSVTFSGRFTVSYFDVNRILI